jgi:hypothetical protein
MLTFKGRGDFSLPALIAAMLFRARSVKGALASHSSRDIWGFGCNVGVGGAAWRRGALERAADMSPQRSHSGSECGQTSASSEKSPLSYYNIPVSTVHVTSENEKKKGTTSYDTTLSAHGDGSSGEITGNDSLRDLTDKSVALNFSIDAILR